TYSTPGDSHGYTGHKMMNDIGIIHMNGRIYDPTLGRFLQADPHIQAPMNSQNYNRYSYVLNNPLSYTDPSGYFFKALGKFVKKYWRAIAAVVIAVYAPYLLETYWGITNAVASGAITGFLSGGVATGSLKGAVVGAFTGAMFGQLHSMKAGVGKVFAHGVAGGVSSVLGGGKFGHGFLAAGFTQGLGNVKGMFVEGATQMADRFNNAIKAAMIGGTASAISGGKFANGAITGAFSRLLNDDAYSSRIKKQQRYDLKDGFEGFVDEYNYKGESRHEIHVYKNGDEVGIFQDGDWINKHGHSGVPDGFGERNAKLLKGLDVHMIRRQGRIPKSHTPGKGMLRGYGKYIPVAGYAVLGTELYNSSNPFQTFFEAFGVNGAGAGSTWEPEGIDIIYPEKD
uniref:RHS repeat domain-containing protein n=1 Tax=Alteromonas lipotrueae TaxID=2803814 RepID=UPI00215C34EF